MKFANGKTFKGQFSYNEVNGEGKLKNADGTQQIKGNWKKKNNF